MVLLLFFLCLFWHAPLGVHSAKRRRQSPDWTMILSHISSFIQRDVIGFQFLLLDCLHPVLLVQCNNCQRHV